MCTDSSTNPESHHVNGYIFNAALLPEKKKKKKAGGGGGGSGGRRLSDFDSK